MLGCSHHDAAVEFRERISFNADQVADVLSRFRKRFPEDELVLLSTCNRVELYTSVSDDSALDHQRVAEFLAQQQELSVEEVFDQMIYRSGHEAVEHLFTVAASLDSMVLGESQISNQVKQAYDLACEKGSAGPLIHSVFQAAKRASKRVQTETLIHRKRVSVPSVAVGEVVPEVFDTLTDKSVVLCGAGEMGEETMRYLIQAGAKDVCVLNRSFERAKKLADEFSVQSAPWNSLMEKATGADLMIGTTAATEPILTVQQFQEIQSVRKGRVCLLLDLAVPRDFDVAIGDLSNVYLYQIDDLQAACQRNRREREREWPKAKKIIAEETEGFLRELNHRATGPVIQRLREHAHQIKADELRRLTGKLQQGQLTESDAKEIEKSFDRLINKLLHPPLSSLRDDAAEGHRRGLLEALRHLFQLGD